MRVRVLLVVATLLFGASSATAFGDPTDIIVPSGFTVKNKTGTVATQSSGFTITNKCSPVVASQGETVCSPGGCQLQRGSSSFQSTYTASSSESFSVGDSESWSPGKFLSRVRGRLGQMRDRIRSR